MTLAIGIIGYGAIGQAVCRLLRASPRCRISAVLTRSVPQDLEGLDHVQGLSDFLRAKHDVVIECAGQSALRDYGEAVLEAGAHLVPGSVGAIVDDGLRAALLRAAQSRGTTIRIPSGAIVGIDGLAAARLMGVDRVSYRGTMPPHALKHFEPSAPIDRRTLVYEGSAREAVARFPKNANLTATIALAGIGFDATRVELHLDPAVAANVHELEASGAFGHLHVEVHGNRLSESSPSSRIVAGSIVQSALGSSFTLLTELLSPPPGHAPNP